MKNESRLSKWRRTLFRSTVALTACVLIGFHTFVASTQSGRRLPKAPPRAPEVAPEPKPAEKTKTEDKAKIGLILGMNGRDIYFNVPLYFYDVVLQSCADKLREAPSLKLDVSGRDMNRGEAVRLAKSQKEGYVAMLEIRSDSMGAGGQVSNNYDEFYVQYSVFAPQTAKTVASGRAYQRVYRNKGVIRGPTTGRTSSVYAERLLKQAGQEAAERIMAALHVTSANTSLR